MGVEPGNTKAWPEASFYGYDTVYDSRNLGYQGPRFGWSRMPDQYTLASFQRNVYGKAHHAPLMAELTLTSSHEPWTPLPRMVDWDAVGRPRIVCGYSDITALHLALAKHAGWVTFYGPNFVRFTRRKDELTDETKQWFHRAFQPEPLGLR